MNQENTFTKQIIRRLNLLEIDINWHCFIFLHVLTLIFTTVFIYIIVSNNLIIKILRTPAPAFTKKNL